MAGSPQHATLVAGVIRTFEFDQDFDTVEMLNRDGTDEVYWRADGEDPEVEGEGSQCCPAGIGGQVLDVPDRPRMTVVKAVCATDQRVSVRIIR